MAKKLIPEELDLLIQEFLTDGVLTEKERQVVLKEAEGMGLDREKIDLYLDAQVQKIEQKIDAAARKQKGKTCPFCGGQIPLLSEKCPHCGGIFSAQASEELQEIFDKLEEALIDMKSGKNISRSKATVERFARKAKMYYSSNSKVQKLLQEVNDEMKTTERKIKAARRNENILSLFKNIWLWVGLIVILIVIGSFIIPGFFEGVKWIGIVMLGLLSWGVIIYLYLYRR